MGTASDEKVTWIYRGDILDKLPEELFWKESRGWDGTEESLLQRKGLVKAVISPKGTEISWPLFAANWSSLFFAMEWLMTAPGPYTLKYFIVGWAEETYDDPLQAIERINQLVTKSDVHLTTRTFVKNGVPEKGYVPGLLKDALRDGTTKPEYSVDCVFDDVAGKFRVVRIGHRSEIARFWGMNPVSYPCQAGNSYDQIISQAYRDVIKSDAPHYDQVCAAMDTPERQTIWFGYQRVVLPQRFPTGDRGVSILSRQSDVDIRFV